MLSDGPGRRLKRGQKVGCDQHGGQQDEGTACVEPEHGMMGRERGLILELFETEDGCQAGGLPRPWRIVIWFGLLALAQLRFIIIFEFR